MNKPQKNSQIFELLHECEPDLALILRFAEKKQQPKFAALFLIFFEVYYACSSSQEPILAKIKLAWWRERLQELAEGAPPRPHPALLELAGNFTQFAQLIEIIDNFERTLDGWQPKSFSELDDFIANSFGKLFNILEDKPHFEQGICYGNAFLLKKLMLNSASFFGQIATRDAAIEHFIQNIKLHHNSQSSAFLTLSLHYKKHYNTKRYKLILKLLFKSKTLF